MIFLKHMNPKTLLRQLATTLSWEVRNHGRKSLTIHLPTAIQVTPRPRELPTPNLLGRLMERVEALEAENRALKKKNSELEDKQAKVVKLLTDD